MPPVRILLADDHVMVRDGLKRLLNEQGDMEVVAEAVTGDDVLRQAQAHAPDVALVDVSLPGRGGVEVAEELARACPGVRVIGLTRHTDPAFMMKMLGAGARGYVLKQSSSVELVTAVRTVVSGAQYIDSSVHLPPAQPAPPASDAGEGEPLTDREAEVLRFTASSLTARQIAQQMTLDIDDVLALKRTAMRKARLLTRIDIIDYARAKGWLA